ncbi:mycothiol transferase [Kitasatospora griseola]|uniref:mycothiol transferase n=1 Tax=Kitasatospora griseola TaxID=2064 RepID=UPI0016710535|nr:DUF664 domain-containing protein [Kitasatospora griseola]GGQ64698.1 hypothetical protein GCM10010195_20310 [Kitasatospora griseola]
MTITDPGTGLRRHLPDAREAVRWTPDGLPERDLRRPLTPTGINLLGPVENLHHGESVAWFRPDLGPAGLEPDTDHRATAEELPLDTVGHVPWWSGPDAAPSRCRVPIHLIAGTARHAGRAGHAGTVREPIDGAVGHRPGDERMPATDDTWWYRYRERAAAAAEQN